MTVSEKADVCIIGAGLGGLGAARRLSEQGKSVIVLEARDRVGGRTKRGSLCGQPVDLGGQWIGPTQTRAVQLCKDLGLEIYSQYAEGKRLLELDGQLHSYQGLIPRISWLALLDTARAMKRINKAAQGIDTSAPWKSVDVLKLDQISAAQWLDRTALTRNGRRLMEILIRAVYTCEPHEVSMLSVLHYISSAGSIEVQASVEDNGAQQWLVRGGAFQMAERLADRLPQACVKLNAAVDSLEQSGSGVRIRHARGEVKASRVIIAVAPQLVAAIHCSPALPAMRMQLQARMPMGSVIKAHVAYERPFWREQGWSGEVASDAGPFGPVFDATPPGSPHGVLVGFFDGGHSRMAAGAPEEMRRQMVVGSLQRYFGEQASSPIGYVDKDWISDPWSRGGYLATTPPGALTACGPALRSPCGRIHWAGSESATRWAGYMDGALESGERAAMEVIEAGT